VSVFPFVNIESVLINVFKSEEERDVCSGRKTEGWASCGKSEGHLILCGRMIGCSGKCAERMHLLCVKLYNFYSYTWRYVG
jgi:hypothetical protein